MLLRNSLLVLCLFSSVGWQTHDEIDWEWIRGVQQTVWNENVIADSRYDVKLSQEDQWAVFVTANSGFSDDWQFMLRRHFTSGDTVSYVIVPDDLRDQAKNLKAENPKLSVKDAAKRIKVQRGVLRSQECPELLDLANKFESVEIPVLFEQVLILDPATFTVVVLPAYRREREFVVFQHENALSDWCLLAYTKILECSRHAR